MTPQDTINYIWWGAAILAVGIYIRREPKKRRVPMLFPRVALRRT